MRIFINYQSISIIAYVLLIFFNQSINSQSTEGSFDFVGGSLIANVSNGNSLSSRTGMAFTTNSNFLFVFGGEGILNGNFLFFFSKVTLI